METFFGRPVRYSSDGYKIISGRSPYQLKIHRLLMEQKIGRPLRNDESVHHIDFDKLNNDMDNLVLLSRTEHARRHNERRYFLCCEACKKWSQYPVEFIHMKDVERGAKKRLKYYGMTHSEAHYAALGTSPVPVVRSDGKEYDSVYDAARDIGGFEKARNIKRNCDKRGHSAYGYKWRYKHEKEFY